MPTPSKSLQLPDGYQTFDWAKRKFMLNADMAAREKLSEIVHRHSELRLYTQHQIYHEDGILKHTRSSPNWEGGVVTYATCKHLMRTYKADKQWEGVWLAGLCPAELGNALLFVGMVDTVYNNNLELRKGLESYSPHVLPIKSADNNPRGDIYTPIPKLVKAFSPYDHRAYHEPPNHTRSIEFYRRSPGSVSDREDGRVPKWWRDIEYVNGGTRPPCFILHPCYIFNQPYVFTSYKPGRAALKLTCGDFSRSLRIMRQPT